MGNKTRQQIGKGSRDKGANGERELAKLIREKWGYETRRGNVFFHQSDIVGLPGIHMEVKRVETLNIGKALEQAEEEASIRNDGLPVVFYRKNYGTWKVVMRLDTLLKILGRETEDLPHIVQMELNEWIDIYGDYWEVLNGRQ